MNEILVQKYGGSSLSDLDRIQQVAQKIVATREKGYDLVVVVSAMGDTTDELLQKAKSLSANPSRHELDMLLSVGERISMALMSIAIQSHGFEAVSLTGSQCGIITTHSHSNARIMDVRPFRVQDELALGRIVIVAGYQGASYRRDVTTLGRGGSDTTAVALAAALGAEACEIYSDVAGVYNADPRVVLNASQLETLSYEEMLEMSRSGARVLNEEAVEFARRAKIALYARSTHEAGKPGTVVRRVDLTDLEIARAEAGCPAVAVSHIARGIWISAGSSADNVVSFLDDLQCAVLEWIPAKCVEAFSGAKDLHGIDSFRLAAEKIGDDVQTDLVGLVSVVGSGIGQRGGWAQEGCRGLEASGLRCLHLSIYPDRLSWIIECGDVEAAANCLHRLFLE